MTSQENNPPKKAPRVPKEKLPPRPYHERRADQRKKHAGSQKTVRFVDGEDGGSFDNHIPFDAEAVAFPTNSKEHEEIKKKRSVSRQRTRAGNSYIADAVISNRFEAYAKPLGKVIADGTQTNLHWAYLYIAGYLCRLGMMPELIPAFIGMVCNHAGSQNPMGNVEGAAATVKKWLNREECAGGRRLYEHFPHIYQEVTRVVVLAQTHANKFDVDQDAKPVELVSYTAAQATVTDIVGDKESTGTVLVIVSPGAGKTFATIEAASRAGDKMNVGFATDTNALAKQVTREFERKGRVALRVFGPGSVQGADECAYRPSAVAFASGGQSVFATMCMGMGRVQCDKFDKCKAKERQEGDPDSPVMVGPHAKLPEILEHVGLTGKLVVDEALPQITTQTISLEDLLHAKQYAENFSNSYTKRMEPIVDTMIAWGSTVGTDTRESVDFNNIPTACVDAIDAETFEAACADAQLTPDPADMAKTVRSLALAAIDPDKPTNPPIKTRVIARIRQQAAFAESIARASKVYSALFHAVARPDLTNVHVGEDDSGRFAKFVFIDPIYARAVNRPNGRTILLDATGETQIHVLKQICPSATIERIYLEDACVVDREIHFTKAYRRQWFSSGGKIAWDGPLKFSLDYVMTVIAEEKKKGRGKVICLVTHKAIRVAIQIALGVFSSDMLDPRAVWRSMGHTEADLQLAIRHIRKYLSTDDTRFVLYHYGAERGRNEGMECDTIFTLGDPRPNVDAIRYEADRVGSDAMERGYMAAAATLTQSQGRARHVSPFRTAGDLRAVHIGSVLPSEPQWHMPDRVRMTFAPLDEDARATMTAEEFSALFFASGKNMGEVAFLLHVCRQTVSKWLIDPETGEGGRAITAADAEAIRAALAPPDPDIPILEAVA